MSRCVLLMLCVVGLGLGAPAAAQATLTLEQAVASLVPGDPARAADPDRVIGDAEILRAIQLWINGEPVPRTGGAVIDDATIQRLIGLWISGEPVSTRPGPPPGPPGFSIQGAVTGASPGDVIAIPQGTYEENVQIDKAITLAPEPGARVVIRGAADAPVIQVNPNVRGVVLRGLELRGGQIGVWLRANSETTLEESTIADNGEGVVLERDAVALLSRNTIRDQSGTGIVIAAASATLLANTVEANAGDGIRFVEGARGQARNNRILSNGDAGVRVLDTTAGVTLAGNLVQGNAGTGFHLERVSQVTLQTNTVSDQGGPGVVLTDNVRRVTLSDNTLSGNVDYGVHAFSRVALTLEGNLIARTQAGSSGPGPGVLLEDRVEAELADNEITQNAGSGVEARRESELTAQGNTISHNDGFGLFADTTSNVSCPAQNVLFDNLQDLSPRIPLACSS